MEDDGALEIWVIFDHPHDFPEHYVVRCQRVTASHIEVTPEVWLRETVDQAREVIAANYPGGCLLARHPDDDPVIVETWI